MVEGTFIDGAAIDAMRRKDLVQKSRLVAIFVLIPISTIYIFFDRKHVEPSNVNIFLRLLSIPTGLVVAHLCGKAWIERVAWLPTFLIGIYTSSVIAIIGSVRLDTMQEYILGPAQMLMVLALLPFHWVEFCALSFLFAAIHFGTRLLIYGFVPLNVLEDFFLMGFAPIAFVLFAISSRLRATVYAKTLQLEKFISERDAVIQSQVDELSSSRTLAVVGKAAQMLAHDVRRPISAARIAFKMLENTKSREEFLEILPTAKVEIEKAARVADSMIKDVMSVGSTHVNKETFCLRAEAYDCWLETLAQHSDAKDIEFSMSKSGEYLVAADKTKIRRAFSNLFDNALAASKPSGRIWVSFRTSSEKDGTKTIRVDIGNTGKSIAPQDLGRLFQPHFTKGKTDGTGLGLHIVRHILGLHGARVFCSSTSKAGTEFAVEFPAMTSHR